MGGHGGEVGCIDVQAAGTHSPTREPGSIGHDHPAHEGGPCTGDQQGDVAADPTTEDRRRPDGGQRRVGVAHEDLARVATSGWDAGLAMAGEVERTDRPRPARHIRRDRQLGRTAEAVQHEQHRSALHDAHRMEGETHAGVVQHDRFTIVQLDHRRNSSTISATS